MSKRGKELEVVAQRLAEVCGKPAQGTFSAEVAEVLAYVFSFDNRVTFDERQSVARAAVKEAIDKGSFSSRALCTTCSREQGKLLAIQPSVYCVVSSLLLPRVASGYGLSLRLSGCKVLIGSKVPKKLLRDAALHAQDLQAKRKVQIPIVARHFSPLAVVLRGRAAAVAHRDAQEVMDCVRGIMNYSINIMTYDRDTNRSTPVNSILPGPLSIVLTSRGKPALGSFWLGESYANDVIDSVFGRVRADAWRKARQHVDEILSRLLSHRFVKEVLEVFGAYARTLDRIVTDTVVLGLWAILETLLDEYRHDDVIKRAMAIWHPSEHPWLRLLMTTVFLSRRNSYVHRAKSVENVEWMVYRLKYMVEDVLAFYLGKDAVELESISDTALYLDLAGLTPGQLRIQNVQSARRLGIENLLRREQGV